MILVLIGLFNSLRQPAVIWLCVPLALIGVTVGLLATGQPFGFMALLGFLSLSGMLIKNAVVLVDEINAPAGEGKELLHAIIDSGDEPPAPGGHGGRHHGPRHDPAARRRLLRRDGGDDHLRSDVRHRADDGRGAGALRDLLPGQALGGVGTRNIGIHPPGVAGCSFSDRVRHGRGPTTRLPSPPSPTSGLSRVRPGVTEGDASLQTWWTQLDDPTLVSLIERAGASNLDLREAIARINEARANLGIASGERLPRVTPLVRASSPS